MHLRLSFSPTATEVLKRCAKQQDVTLERFAFLQLRQTAGNYAQHEAALQAKGKTTIAWMGVAFDLTPSDLPELKLEDAGDGPVDVLVGPKLLARLEFCAKVVSALNAKRGVLPEKVEWKTVREWAQQVVLDSAVSIAAGASNRELDEEEKDLETERRLEAARTERRKAAEGG